MSLFVKVKNQHTSLSLLVLATKWQQVLNTFTIGLIPTSLKNLSKVDKIIHHWDVTGLDPTYNTKKLPSQTFEERNCTLTHTYILGK
jgi:hypothetical protein